MYRFAQVFAIVGILLWIMSILFARFSEKKSQTKSRDVVAVESELQPEDGPLFLKKPSTSVKPVKNARKSGKR
jgi:hypothetical protein